MLSMHRLDDAVISYSNESLYADHAQPSNYLRRLLKCIGSLYKAFLLFNAPFMSWVHTSNAAD